MPPAANSAAARRRLAWESPDQASIFAPATSAICRHSGRKPVSPISISRRAELQQPCADRLRRLGHRPMRACSGSFAEDWWPRSAWPQRTSEEFRLRLRLRLGHACCPSWLTSRDKHLYRPAVRDYFSPHSSPKRPSLPRKIGVYSSPGISGNVTTIMKDRGYFTMKNWENFEPHSSRRAVTRVKKLFCTPSQCRQFAEAAPPGRIAGFALVVLRQQRMCAMHGPALFLCALPHEFAAWRSSAAPRNSRRHPRFLPVKYAGSRSRRRRRRRDADRQARPEAGPVPSPARRPRSCLAWSCVHRIIMPTPTNSRRLSRSTSSRQASRCCCLRVDDGNGVVNLLLPTLAPFGQPLFFHVKMRRQISKIVQVVTFSPRIGTTVSSARPETTLSI